MLNPIQESETPYIIPKLFIYKRKVLIFKECCSRTLYALYLSCKIH